MAQAWYAPQQEAVQHICAILRTIVAAALRRSTQSSAIRHTSDQYSNPPPPPRVISEIAQMLLKEKGDGKTCSSLLLRRIKNSPDLLQYVTNYESAERIAEALACSRNSFLALRFLPIPHALQCQLRHVAYENVAFHFAEKKNWRSVLSAVSFAQEHQKRLSLRLLNWRTRVYVELEDYRALRNVLDEFKEHRKAPNRRTFHLILSGHLRNCDLPNARECLKKMEDAGIPPDATTHATVATHYRRLGMDPDVEARAIHALPDLPSTTAVPTVNHLIILRLDALDVTGALRLCTLFEQSVMEPIINMMAQYQDIGKSEVVGLEHAPNIAPLVPNASTYSIFINYLASKSNVRGALQIFRDMLSTQTQVTPHAFASLINALYLGGRGDIAVRMVASMCDPAEVPSGLFDELLSSHASDNIPWVPTGISPSIRIFNSLIKGALTTHGLRGMESVLQIMEGCKVKPTSSTLELLVSHVKQVEHGHPRVLSRLLRRLSSHNVLPTLQHMHIIFSSVLHDEKNHMFGFGWDNIAAKFSNTRTAVDRVVADKRISSEAPYFDPTAGIELPAALRQKSLIRPSVESLQSRDVMSDNAMFALRIRHDSVIKSDMVAAKEIFDTMLNRGIRPNEYHISALMEGFTRSGDMDSAFDVLKSAKDAGIPPNVVMFTILIVGYAHRGNPDKAIQVFEDMVSSGIAPDVPSIDAVVSAFFVIGAYNMAKTVLRTLWSYIQPLPPDFEQLSLKGLIQAFRRLRDKSRLGDYELVKEKRTALHFRLLDLMATWSNRKEGNLGYKLPSKVHDIEEGLDCSSNVQPLGTKRSSEVVNRKQHSKQSSKAPNQTHVKNRRS
ncbi:hypothetical protein H0H93_004214 [Arthromyces matolae]|nr:hypothetical protein H0H93_004214 [Arthromyces matolae]